MASTNAFSPETSIAAYNAATARVVGLTGAAAIELEPFGTTVDAVCPGPICTDKPGISSPILSTAGRYLEHVPTGSLRITQAVAGAVAYLVSGDAALATGHHPVVAGGQTIGVDVLLETVAGER